MSRFSFSKPWPYYLVVVAAGLALLTPLLGDIAIGRANHFNTVWFQTMSLLAGAAWAALAWSDPRYRPNWRNPLVVAALAWAAWLLISLLFAVDPALSFWSDRRRMAGVLLQLHWVVWLLALGSCLRSWSDWRWLLGGSQVVAAVVGVIGLAELAHHSAGWRIESTLGNSIFLAYYILPHLFLSLIFLARSRRWLSRLPWIALGLLHLAVIVQTGTRGALIGLLVGLLLAGLGCLFMFGRNRRRSALIGLGVLATLVVLAGFFSWLRLSDTGDAWGHRVLPKVTHRYIYADLGSDRLSLWRIGLQGWREHPVTGRGLENYTEPLDRLILAEADSSLSETWYDRTHNQFLDYLLGAGLIGLLIYLSILGSAGWLLVRGLRPVKNKKRKEEDATKTKDDKTTLWLLLSLIVAQAVAYFFAFETVAGGILFWSALAMALAFTSPPPEDDQASRLSPIQILGAIALIFLALLASWWLSWRPYAQSSAYETAVVKLYANPAVATENIEKIMSKPSFVTHELRLNFIDRIRSFIEGIQLGRDSLEPMVKLAASQIDYSLDSRGYSFKFVLAGAYIYRERAKDDPAVLPRARELAEKAIALAPNRPEGYEELAEISLVERNLKGAWEQLELALEKSRTDMTDGRIMMRRAGLYAMNNDLESADVQIALAAAKFNIALDFREVLLFAPRIQEGESWPAILEYHRKVAAARPTHPIALGTYIIALYRTGQIETATARLNKMAEIDRQSAQSLAESLGLNLESAPATEDTILDDLPGLKDSTE